VTIVKEFVVVKEIAAGPDSFAAAAAAIFSQPSRQPAPAIQRATASASPTRTILIEEKNLIALPSLTVCAFDVEPHLTTGDGRELDWQTPSLALSGRI
jgi:hypothetical protein